MALESSTPIDQIAIAFVVDASTTVANEWKRILLDYVTPMVKRLAETHAGAKVRSHCFAVFQTTHFLRCG
jgi:hypothetical protein